MARRWGVEVVGQLLEGTADHVRLASCEVSVAQCLTHAVPLRVERARQPLPTACVAPVESRPMRDPTGRVTRAVTGSHVVGCGQQSQL
jgi:hypothetical protein